MIQKMLKQVGLYLFAALWFVISFYPFVFMVNTSLKGRMEFLIKPVWAFPEKFLYTNYLSRD